MTITRPVNGSPSGPTPAGTVPVSAQASPKYCPVTVNVAPRATRLGLNFTVGVGQAALAVPWVHSNEANMAATTAPTTVPPIRLIGVGQPSALLDRHQAGQLVDGGRGGQRGDLGVVICRSDLDHVRGNQVHAGQTTKDHHQLAGRHPGDLGSAGAGSVRRI